MQCPFCQRAVLAPSLSSLRELPAVERRRPIERSPFQYRLRDLLILVAVWAVCLSAGTYLGFDLMFGILYTFIVTLVFWGAFAGCLRRLRRALCTFWDSLEQDREEGS